jgi:vitamin B12 transporter
MSYVTHFKAGLRRRRSSLLASFAAVLAAGVPTAAIAQQSASPQNVLPTLVVSPTGVPTPETNIASSVTLITSEDIEREQRRTISDVLANVPGLNIVQAGGPGKQTSIFMRGTESNHVKVLIDGIDASNPGTPGGAFDFAHLLASDIERVEVLRGPQSGLYGANAIGGVISITTKRGSGPPKATVTAEGGSFNTFNQYGSLSGSVGPFDYAFGVAHLRTDGTSNVPLYLQQLQPVNRPRLTDKYENTTLSSKTGLQISDDFRINSVVRYTDGDLKFVQNPGEFRSYQIVHHLFTRQEAVWSGFDGRFVNYFGVNYSDQWSSNRGPAVNAVASINRGERVKLDWRGVTTLLPGHILVTGAEHDTERAVSRTLARTSFGENANTAGYAELQSQFAERVFVTANVRHDENERFGGATTYRVAPAVLLPVTETKLKASYGTGFKAPSVDELFFSILSPPFFNFFANPNLRPEHVRGWDAGFEQPVFDNRLRFGATYFQNDISDLITFQQLTLTDSTLINIDRAKTSGVETFVAIQPFRTFGIRGDYTYTKAIDATTDLELLRRPKNKASVTVSWLPIDPLTLSLTVLHVGEWVDVSRFGGPFVNRPIVPGYTVVNVAADYRLNEYAKVFARIDNLFNERYENPNGFERPGFAVYGGVRLTN